MTKKSRSASYAVSTDRVNGYRCCYLSDICQGASFLHLYTCTRQTIVALSEITDVGSNWYAHPCLGITVRPRSNLCSALSLLRYASLEPRRIESRTKGRRRRHLP